ncbi:MAG: hypothetical protein F4076_07055 [Acidimicrobiaceae bacterium]|nr:hypothetical protein [Acidimicrobiaceae bacterium]MYE74924.1 hypothetical protein [Acidimicrobiaceae bacterium]MYJ42187.1 hypothetical protein [Acidimicrobiaceae bacterium]MYJ81176.1 hypothetical protein [Acidimicrobiaceae bacterium]
MQLVKFRSAVSAAASTTRELASAVRELRTLLHTWGPVKATVVGVAVWAIASAAFAATVGVGALNFDALACDYPSEMFSALRNTTADSDMWFNTPWTFGVASVCIAVSIQCAHLIRLRTVIAVAWCSIPWQASFWHGLLVLPECS